MRAEAIRRRDHGFAHCSHEFLVAYVGSLKHRMVLVSDHIYIEVAQELPNTVAMIVDGVLNVMVCDRIVKSLHVGDVVGKHWLLSTKKP
jgi:hypothetical protein